MSRYTKYKERQKNASIYAKQVVCCKCVHCEQIRANAFCNGFGKSKRIPECVYVDSKEGYCTQYWPKGEKINESLVELNMGRADSSK